MRRWAWPTMGSYASLAVPWHPSDPSVSPPDEAVAAIARLDQIDRRACRAAVERRFTVDRMADEYLALYRRLLGR